VFLVCSFCADRPVVAWFQGPDYPTSVGRAEDVVAEEAWLASPHCLDLVEADGRYALVERAKRRDEASTAGPDHHHGAIRESHDRFWGTRSR
jgi:hypothetical protein